MVSRKENKGQPSPYARRRKAGELSATQRQQWFILESLLRSIRFNDEDMIQRLIEAIRNDESPPKLAETFRNNIQAVDKLGELAKQDINDADIITLVLQCLCYPSSGPRALSPDSESQKDFLAQPSSSLSDSSSTSTPSYDMLFDDVSLSTVQSSIVEHEGKSATDTDSISISDFIKIPDATLSDTLCSMLTTAKVKQSSDFPIAPEVFDSVALLPTIDSAQVANFEAKMASSEHQSPHRRCSLPSTLQSDGVCGTCFYTKGWDYPCNPSPIRTFTLPSIYPGDPVNDIVIDFRDRARDLLKSGASLRTIMGFGATDVELLFRTRKPDDELTVPSWACEATSDLENFDFSVRLAQVFMRVRFMRWLILPNAETFAGIPGILKPTLAQMRFPHSVIIDFLPIPAIRNRLVRNLQDWHTPLSKAKYTCNWDESRGPAVVTDPSSGRRCLSPRPSTENERRRFNDGVFDTETAAHTVDLSRDLPNLDSTPLTNKVVIRPPGSCKESSTSFLLDRLASFWADKSGIDKDQLLKDNNLTDADMATLSLLTGCNHQNFISLEQQLPDKATAITWLNTLLRGPNMLFRIYDEAETWRLLDILYGKEQIT
ncbi:hypothetical protein B0A52_08919, partial [Exophiala mesophila]